MSFFKRAGKWLGNVTGLYRTNSPPPIRNNNNYLAYPSGNQVMHHAPAIPNQGSAPQQPNSSISGWEKYLPAAISAAGNVAGSWINAKSQKSVNEAQIAHNMQMYGLSRDDAIAMWHMQNEYNLPSAHMQRLKEAGLNPHLVYGSGAQVTAGSPESHSASPANLGVPQYGDIASSLGSYIGQAAITAQTAKTRAETGLISENTEYKAFDNAVRVAVGEERMARNQRRMLASSDAQAQRQVSEIEQWIYSMFDSTEGVQQFQVDEFGTRQMAGANNRLHQQHIALTDNQKQAVVNMAEEFKLLQKRGTLYDQQSALNEIQIKLQDFNRVLADAGLNPTSLKAITVILTVLRSIFGAGIPK